MNAVIDAAWTDADAPWVVVKGQMCGYFHCRPSELDDEPWDELMHIWQAHILFENTRAERLAAHEK